MNAKQSSLIGLNHSAPKSSIMLQTSAWRMAHGAQLGPNKLIDYNLNICNSIQTLRIILPSSVPLNLLLKADVLIL